MDDEIHQALERVTGSGAVTAAAAARLPSAPGAYLLALRLGRAVVLRIRRFHGISVDPGIYVYGGSAHGPGGIAGRVRRHFRQGKRRHWHIDHLSGAAAELSAFVRPGGRECALLEALLAGGGFAHAVKGFGSSDCSHCCSHLLRWHGANR